MSKQIIMRPVYNRPEMLALSFEYEYKAREYFNIGPELHTIFIVEFDSDSKVLELIDNYKYKNTVIKRTSKFGLSANILEGFKVAFDLTDDWLLYIEDDILLHKTYFKYIHALLNKKELFNFSVLSPYSFTDVGSVDVVRMDRHYAALAPVISKNFYETFVYPCSNNYFYSDPATFVLKLNTIYEKYQHDRTYRYKDATHHQQAGLINRLCDVARIESGMHVVMPEISRMQHIGIYGYNRVVGKKLQGSTFEERLQHLKKVILEKDLMYDMAGSKQYNDYKVFSTSLSKWTGNIILADKHFTS